MNRPFILIRILGAPLVALPVLLLCGALVVGWYQGHTSWLIAFIAAGVAFRTFSAARRMRSYKAWRKAWQAMSPDDETERPQESRGISAIFLAALLLFAFGYPAYMGSIPVHELPTARDSMLVFLWCLTCLYLVIRLGWSFMRRRSLRRNAQAQPVAWMIGKASSCPSRSSATQALPEYCARLLSGSANKKRLEARGHVSLSAS
jgi:hypothetical protein